MAIRAAFSMGVDLAGADRLMVINKISIIKPLPASYEQRRSAQVEGVNDITHANWFGGYYQESRNQFANMAVEPESWLRMYPEFERARGSEEGVAGGSHRRHRRRRHGEAVRLEGRRRVPLQATIYRRPDGGAWEFTIDGIYDSPIKGADKTQLLLPLRVPERDDARRNAASATRSAGT